VHDATCQVCSSPSGDAANLCRVHTDDLVAELKAVPDLLAELDITITRQNRTTAERNGGRSSTTPLPWNEHASAVRSDLWSTLGAWAHDVSKLGEDERDRITDVDTYDTAGVADWLVRNVATLRMHGEAGTAHEEIIDAVRQARRAIDTPPEQVAYGKCLNDEDRDAPCEEYLYGLPGKDFVYCRVCGAKHNTALRKDWMLEQVRILIGTATEVAGYLRLAGVKVTADRVRGMAARDRFHPAQFDEKERPLYRVSDVLVAIGDRYKRRSKTEGDDGPDLQRSNPAA
jgi:hypothetical protein